MPWLSSVANFGEQQTPFPASRVPQDSVTFFSDEQNGTLAISDGFTLHAVSENCFELQQPSYFLEATGGAGVVEQQDVLTAASFLADEQGEALIALVDPAPPVNPCAGSELQQPSGFVEGTGGGDGAEEHDLTAVFGGDCELQQLSGFVVATGRDDGVEQHDFFIDVSGDGCELQQLFGVGVVERQDFLIAVASADSFSSARVLTSDEAFVGAEEHVALLFCVDAE